MATRPFEPAGASPQSALFASRVTAVRAKYHLTIDRLKAATLNAIIKDCASTELDCLSPEPLPGSPALPPPATAIP